MSKPTKLVKPVKFVKSTIKPVKSTGNILPPLPPKPKESSNEKKELLKNELRRRLANNRVLNGSIPTTGEPKKDTSSNPNKPRDPLESIRSSPPVTKRQGQSEEVEEDDFEQQPRQRNELSDEERDNRAMNDPSAWSSSALLESAFGVNSDSILPR